MRIEVAVDQCEPQVYPLNQPKIMIGSSESCDIVLTTDGISRKHLLVINEEDDFFVIDQGSTNGTFINEERLVPGKRSPFTSFFPVRLGDNVLLTLLSDEESRAANLKSLNISKSDASSPSLTAPKVNESTRTLTRNDLHRSMLTKSSLSTKASKGKSKTKPKKTSDDKQMKLVSILALIIVAGAAYYNLSPEDQYNNQVPETQVAQSATSPEVSKSVPAEAPVTEVPPVLIPEAEVTSRAELNKLLADFKCLSENEKFLCESIPDASQTGWGVTQVGTTLNVMVDGSSYFKLAQDLLPQQRTDIPLSENYIADRKLLMAALFIKNGITGNLINEKIKDYKLSFGLFLDTAEGKKVEVAFAGYPKSIMDAKPLIPDDMVNTPRQVDIQTRLAKVKEIIRFY